MKHKIHCMQNLKHKIGGRKRNKKIQTNFFFNEHNSNYALKNSTTSFLFGKLRPKGKIPFRLRSSTTLELQNNEKKSSLDFTAVAKK